MSALYLDSIKKAQLDAGFTAAFGAAPVRYFSTPVRTEIGGNHTDHQRGRVLAAAVNLDTVAAVRPNGSHLIRIQSAGYPLYIVDVTALAPVEAERNTTAALVRGVAARFTQMGCKVGGFDAYCESTVLPGSGLSSSAAFEVLMGTVINHLFFAGKATQPEIAMIGQYAENVFFGKPCGLMDQTASAVGNLITIDFFDKDHPMITPVDVDFSTFGHALCILDTGADHADLTEEYAAIARRRGENFELDLVLRCNITAPEHPLGVFHPHADKHHIKKENIGLSEVMGLAVLPCRLKGELHALAEALAAGADLYADERLVKHSLWAEELKTRYTFTRENAMDILLQETGRVFCQVLGDAGVFPNTPTGRTQFLRFVQEVR